MLRKYVTSMNRKIFEEYGEEMLRGFCRYWPKGEMVVYTEDGELPFKDARVRYKNLMHVAGMAKFLAGTSCFPIMSGLLPDGKNYRYNVNAFARKAFAQMDAATNWPGHLAWIDADVMTFKHIPGAMLDGMQRGAFIAMMKRKTWHACSSFVQWDCAHSVSAPWWRHYRGIYENGYVFLEQQWDDAYIMERVCEQLPGVKDIAEHVTGEGPYNVLDDVFAGYARHLKGGLKNIPQPKRYAQLLDLVSRLKPARLVEIGTWNGDRALQFGKVAPGVEYIGLDLFESANEGTDATEKNVKRHHSVTEVGEKLLKGGMKYRLFSGDSKATMPRYLGEYGEKSADLIFIDGGHSVETIREDFKNSMAAIKPGGLIVLDDYYTDMPSEELDKFGAQAVLRGMPHIVLPIKDLVAGGGFTQMAVVEC